MLPFVFPQRLSKKRTNINERLGFIKASLPFYKDRQSRCLYDHLNVNEIRLLRVQPGRKGDKLVCSLHTVDLLAYDDIGADASIEGFERYEAISYCWGGQRPTAKIDCNGIRTYITQNLADALEALRCPTLVKVLWADALCIDQRNNMERAEQVKLMGLIYWKARRVRIWLGRDDNKEESYCARDAIKVIKELAYVHSIALGTTAADYKAYVNMKFDEPDRISDGEWAAIHRLLRREWFSRVWVVQEIGLARDAIFHCGEQHFTRSEIEDFRNLVHNSRMYPIKQYTLDLQMLNLGHDYWLSCWGNTRLELGSDPKEAETFLDILARTRGLRCTDLRDSIYAFLGHPSAFKQQVLDIDPYHWYPRNYYEKRTTIVTPNYKKSNTYLQVYHQLAVSAIANIGLGSSVLSHIAHNEFTINADYPSWIPRWDVSGPTKFAGAKEYFAASGSLSTSAFTLSSSRGKGRDDQLSFKALRLDTIRCVYRAPVDEDLKKCLDVMALLLSDAPIMRKPNAIPIPSSLTYPYEEPFVLAFASTMTAGLTSSWNSSLMPTDDYSERHLRNFHAFYRRRYQSDSATLSSEEEEHAGYFALDFERETQNKVMFITHNGRLGLGPPIMEGLDEIWIPLGSKMPVILRPCYNGTFKIIGQTYVYGIMRGEAVQSKSEDDFEEVTLC